jgi:hypothetical protein
MTSPGRSARPGAPATWVRSWNVRSARAEVGHAEADVGVDHPDQRHAREVVALGDHLRAHQDVGLPRLERGQRSPRPRRGAPESRSSRSTRAARSRRLHRLHDLLGAVAGEAQVFALHAPQAAASRASCPQ